MKKHLLFVLLVISFSASISIAGMNMRGNIAKEKPNGEVASVEFYGSIIKSPDRVMSHALTQARGQFLLHNSAAEMELRTTSPISAVTGTAIELNANGKVKIFLITPDTIFCDFNRVKSGPEILHTEDVVTVSSGLDEKVASEIRRGPMYFTGVMAGSPELQDIDCLK